MYFNIPREFRFIFHVTTRTASIYSLLFEIVKLTRDEVLRTAWHNLTLPTSVSNRIFANNLHRPLTTKKRHHFSNHEYRTANISNSMYDIRNEKERTWGTAKYNTSLQSSVSPNMYTLRFLNPIKRNVIHLNERNDSSQN